MGTLSLEELIKNVVAAGSLRQSSDNSEQSNTDDVSKEGETPMEVDVEDPVPKPETGIKVASSAPTLQSQVEAISSTSQNETGERMAFGCL